MTPGLSYYWEGAREQCEDSKWDEKKEKEKKEVFEISRFGLGRVRRL